MKLSIIVPVFNEEKTIKLILEKVASVKLPKEIKKEIIVVDDGSTDKTWKVLSKYQMSPASLREASPKAGEAGRANVKYQILRHEKNRGKGVAIRTGLNHAKGDLIIIQDADLEYNPADYSKLMEPVLKGKADVVYGSRLISYPLRLWGKNKTILPLHLVANKVLTQLTNWLYGSSLTDMETGYKLFKKEVLKKITIESKNFDFEPEVTVKILKLKIPIQEVPIKVKPRTYEEGKKIGFIDGLFALWTLIKYRF